MNTKTVLSLVFSATLVLAILGNLLFAKKMLLAIVLVLNGLSCFVLMLSLVPVRFAYCFYRTT